MTGPYPPHHGIGPAGPSGIGPHPGVFPPPMPQPRRSRGGLIAGMVVAAVLVAVLAALAGYAVRGSGAGAPSGAGVITEASAKTTIQGYLNALLDRDIDAVARNSLCGIYDGVADRRSDDAVARLTSDAFRKQFAQAEVTSIDKIVHLSGAQAQALFTMRVTRVSGDQRRDRTQGVAQLLSADGDVLVCSLTLRTAGTL